jgi:hypothetical protein
LITFSHVKHFTPLVEKSWVGFPVGQRAIIHHPLEGKSWFAEGDLWSISDYENGGTLGAKNGGFEATNIPMNTFPQIKPHQLNNQPQFNLYKTCYLDKCLQIDLVLSFLQFFTMPWNISDSWR